MKRGNKWNDLGFFVADGISYDLENDCQSAEVIASIIAYEGHVTIPETVNDGSKTYPVTGIALYAFKDCTELVSVNIPASITSIYMNPFEGCYKLVSINVDKENAHYSSLSGVLYNKACSSLICVPAGREGKFVIPDGVKIVGRQAFHSCKKITSVLFPKSVLFINPDILESINNREYTEKELVLVYKETLDAIRRRSYEIVKDGNPVNIVLNLNDVQASTVFFDKPYPPDENTPCFYGETLIEVIDCDTLDAAKKMIDEEGVRPIVLNMADSFNPGGLVDLGADTQEENLFRRSDYLRSLYQFKNYASDYADMGVARNKNHSYPLHERDGAVYSPLVTVFRGNEADGYPFLEQPYTVDFVAIAAICLLHGSLSQKEAETMRHKINLLLRICKSTGHTHLVLSALGCGAFCNPPKKIAAFFSDALQSDEFRHAFRHVVFAIRDKGRLKSNFRTFNDIICCARV